MLNFKELSKDGTDLELLTREIFKREGFEVHWTGKGPDGGRDLIVIERIQGPLSSFKRKWLVQCKHYAHSGKSVGKDEANSLITDCERIKADGYLLVCTTSLSSGLILAYEELKMQRNMFIEYWDEVRLEDRLLSPVNFQLINQFFPISTKSVGWKIYNTNSPSFWAAHFKNSFIYLSARLNMHFPTLTIVEKIYEYSEAISTRLGITTKLRAVYYDDKHTSYLAFLDFLVDEKKDNIMNLFGTDELDDINDQIEDSLPFFVEVEHGGLPLQWDVIGYSVNKSHDGYNPNAQEFYTRYIKNFESGYRRS